MLNPVSGLRTFISRRNAERYVARGRARWQGAALLFIEDDHSCVSAKRSAKLDSQLAYDRIGRMTVDQLKGVPLLGDPSKLFHIR